MVVTVDLNRRIMRYCLEDNRNVREDNAQIVAMVWVIRVDAVP